MLVREPAEFGSLAAAERAGVPHVQVAIGMTEMSRLMVVSTVEPLAQLAGLVGLPDEALADALAAEPGLSSVPATLDRAGDDEFAEESVAFRYRDDASPDPAAPLPAWGDPELPLVYVTFGSVTGSLAPFAGVFREALDGLADLPVRVLMTVGRRVDLDGLGPLPTNARVEAWWPQADVLRHADAVLGHGGFGTTLGALAAGVPQVVAPIFTSDQVINARHVAAAGVGRAVIPGPDVVVRACAEVRAVLSDPGTGRGRAPSRRRSPRYPPPQRRSPWCGRSRRRRQRGQLGRGGGGGGGATARPQLLEDRVLALGQGQQVLADPDLAVAARVDPTAEGRAAGDRSLHPLQLGQQVLLTQPDDDVVHRKPFKVIDSSTPLLEPETSLPRLVYYVNHLVLGFGMARRGVIRCVTQKRNGRAPSGRVS